jgi:hypothetical protein
MEANDKTRFFFVFMMKWSLKKNSFYKLNNYIKSAVMPYIRFNNYTRSTRTI